MNAFLSAWRSTTARSDSPFAEAVRTKSWRSTSSIWARVSRISEPESASPRMTAGMITCARFLAGSSSRRV